LCPQKKKEKKDNKIDTYSASKCGRKDQIPFIPDISSVAWTVIPTPLRIIRNDPSLEPPEQVIT
jgi:hypothetical protein